MEKDALEKDLANLSVGGDESSIHSAAPGLRKHKSIIGDEPPNHLILYLDESYNETAAQAKRTAKLMRTDFAGFSLGLLIDSPNKSSGEIIKILWPLFRDKKPSQEAVFCIVMGKTPTYKDAVRKVRTVTKKQIKKVFRYKGFSKGSFLDGYYIPGTPLDLTKPKGFSKGSFLDGYYIPERPLDLTKPSSLDPCIEKSHCEPFTTENEDCALQRKLGREPSTMGNEFHAPQNKLRREVNKLQREVMNRGSLEENCELLTAIIELAGIDSNKNPSPFAPLQITAHCRVLDKLYRKYIASN